LQSANIDARGGSQNSERRLRKTYSFAVHIQQGDFNDALSVASTEGYFPAELLGPGALRSISRTRDRLSLIKADKVTTRMTLRWNNSTKRGRIAKQFQPENIDYRAVRLPVILSPLYGLVRPIRRVFQRVSGWQGDSHLGQFLGTPDELILPLLDCCQLSETDILYDLGCGDGRVVITAARERGCRAVGIEEDDTLVEMATSQINQHNLADRVNVYRGDVRDADISSASVVFLFLPIQGLPSLVQMLKQQLASGARIVAHEQLPLPDGMEPDVSTLVVSAAAITVAHVWKV